MDLAALRDVTTIVTHANCADGIVSALLCKAALPSARVLFVQYGSAEHRNLKAESGMLFVDMTPLRERVADFVAAGAFCLDHHVHQKDIVEAFGNRGVYSDKPGESGAVLAYRDALVSLLDKPYIIDSAASALATLAGIYDTWQTSNPDWVAACEWREAAMVIPYERLAALPLTGVCDLFDLVGPLVFRKAMAAARAAAGKAKHVTLGGARVALVPTRETNYVAGLVDADYVAGFAHDADAEGANPRIVWSLRACNGYDVGAVAKRHGGGGHEGAGGFSVPDDGRSPLAMAAGLFGYDVQVGDVWRVGVFLASDARVEDVRRPYVFAASVHGSGSTVIGIGAFIANRRLVERDGKPVEGA